MSTELRESRRSSRWTPLILGTTVALMGSVVAPSVVAASVSTGATKEALPTLDKPTTKKLEKIVAAQFAKSGMPGVAVRVTIGKRHWEDTIGVADLESKKPFVLDGNVRIASITKTFTATAILQLVDKHKLSLDDTVESFVPGIPNGDKITVRDLLAMQSGIYDFSSDPTFGNEFLANPDLPWTPDDAVEIMKTHPSDFEPGTKTAYCDSNYVLLGLILEKVTGKDAEAVINDNVVKKAGLPNTDFPTTAGIPDPHPTGYVPDTDDPSAPLTRVGDINPAVAWTAGAMISRVRDLERWAEVLADGSLLSAKLQRERLVEHRFEGQKINIGYGLGVERLNDLVGHNGAILGFSTAMYRYPKADATFVVTGNASTNFTTPTTEIALLMIKELYPKQVR